MYTVAFKAGDTILSEGAEGKTAYLIVSGTVEVIVGWGKAAKVLGALQAGEVFGEMCLIEPGARSATVKAVTDTECVATTYDEFIAAIDSDPRQAVHFMKTLVRRLRAINERIARLDPGKAGLSDLIRSRQKSPGER